MGLADLLGPRVVPCMLLTLAETWASTLAKLCGLFLKNLAVNTRKNLLRCQKTSVLNGWLSSTYLVRKPTKMTKQLKKKLWRLISRSINSTPITTTNRHLPKFIGHAANG